MILAGSRIALRPTTPEDAGTIDLIDAIGEAQGTWRRNGTMPSPAARIADTWAGVLAQRLVVERTQGVPLGYVTAYDANLRDGTAWLAVAATAESTQQGTSLLGLAIFISELFGEWPLRKLYAACADDALVRYRSVIRSGLFVEEGRLSNDLVRPDGRMVDVLWLALTRDRWAETWGPVVRRRLMAADRRFRERARDSTHPGLRE